MEEKEMSGSDVENVAVGNEESRYEGYEDKDCPDFADLCRRFYCGLFDHGCDEECRLIDKTLPYFLCEVCDLNNDKECPTRMRKYIHKKFVPKGIVTQELNDKNETRDEMETELGLLRREKDALLQKYRLEQSSKVKRHLLRDHDVVEKQILMLERLLKYKKTDEDEYDDWEEDDEEDAPVRVKTKPANKKFLGFLKHDPLEDGKNSMEQFKKIVFWVIAIGAGLAWYFTG